MLATVNTTTLIYIWNRIKVQSIIPLNCKNNCIISHCNQQPNTKIFIANEMMHTKYIKINFILTTQKKQFYNIIFCQGTKGLVFLCL